MNKKGLSSVVNTVLIILLVIVAITSIWAVINTFITHGASQIGTSGYTLNLKIQSAKINYTTGVAVVKVKRNAGAGELTGIRFIVEDNKSADVFDRAVVNFNEFAERTFTLNLLDSSVLDLPNINKISIAPLYISGSGDSETEGLGRISDFVGDLNLGINTIESGDNIVDMTAVCTQNSDCGIDEWVEGSEVCSEDKGSISQYKTIYTCEEGSCDYQTIYQMKEDCPTGVSCYNAECLAEPISCTVDTVDVDCGYSGFVGIKGCDPSNLSLIIQGYQTFSCIDSICFSDTSSVVVDECAGEEVCHEGGCFLPVECSVNSDCWDIGVPNGEICSGGNCILENTILSGVVRSVWPYGIGEYMDSLDLPLSNDGEISLEGLTIIFPESNQKSCLSIKKFITPTFDGGISYIKFNVSLTDVVAGDNFQIWETPYICSTL